jgi:hypothetical protein
MHDEPSKYRMSIPYKALKYIIERIISLEQKSKLKEFEAKAEDQALDMSERHR